jgi:hypothetical protein
MKNTSLTQFKLGLFENCITINEMKFQYTAMKPATDVIFHKIRDKETVIETKSYPFTVIAVLQPE